jgi:hypothetical protein
MRVAAEGGKSAKAALVAAGVIEGGSKGAPLTLTGVLSGLERWAGDSSLRPIVESVAAAYYTHTGRGTLLSGKGEDTRDSERFRTVWGGTYHAGTVTWGDAQDTSPVA